MRVLRVHFFRGWHVHEVGPKFILSFEEVAHDGARWRSAFHLDEANFFKSGNRAGKERHGTFFHRYRLDTLRNQFGVTGQRREQIRIETVKDLPSCSRNSRPIPPCPDFRCDFTDFPPDLPALLSGSRIEMQMLIMFRRPIFSIIY